MRLPNLVCAAGGALLLALLSGCASSDASTPPEPSTTFVAPYATDEEALAAAEAAYADYVRVTGKLYAQGASDSSSLSTVASGFHLKELLAEFDKRQVDGRYIIGEQTFDQMVLQRYSRDGSANEIVAVYLCDDLSGLEVYRGDERVGPSTPLPPVRMQVVFDYDSDSASLRVSTRDIWGKESC